MLLQLNPNELRVIGCLIEKSLTTPDQYPLSLNALTNACNQKSNREPVLDLAESEVQDTVDALKAKHLVVNQAGATSRVVKYRHRFCNTEFGDLQLTSKEIAILCVMFLRGPQTPGELRTRTNRLCEFKDAQDTENVLNKMSDLERGPLVIKLDREPGKRESRYAHCFTDLNDVTANQKQHSNRSETTEANAADNSRLSALEEQVELMQMEIDELREKLNQILNS